MSHISLTYHIIWRTKCSKPTINEKYEKELYKYIHGMCKGMDSYLYRINSMPDHVHMCVEVDTKYSLSKFMQVIKQESSKWMKEHEEWFPDFDYWANGYGAFTYAARERDTIISYIKKQKEHHKDISLEDEFNNILVEFGLNPAEDLFFKDDPCLEGSTTSNPWHRLGKNVIKAIVIMLVTLLSFVSSPATAQNYIFLPVAMEREVSPLIQGMEDVDTLDISGFRIYKGKIGNNDVIAGVSGPGLINMSSMMSLICTRYNVSAVINYGMVGGYGKLIHKGDLIICSEAMSIASYMTSRKKTGINIRKWNYITFTDGGKDGLVIYESDSTLSAKATVLGQRYQLHRGRIGSADIWNNERKMIRMLMRRYSIICEDMEAVAAYQLSQRFGIPCISIKGVSDNCFLNEDYDDSVIPVMNDFVREYLGRW